MKKLISIILIICLFIPLYSCASKAELKTLELTDEILDISAMGQLDNIFTSENRNRLISTEPEMNEYYYEYHDYAHNIHEREDYTSLRVFSEVIKDDENFYIEKTYSSDIADGRICRINISCQVQIPDGEFTEDELRTVAAENMNSSVEKFRTTFGFSEDKLVYEPPFDDEYNKSFIWTDDDYKYSYNCRYVGGEKGDNDLCRINISVSSMEFLRKYHDDL